LLCLENRERKWIAFKEAHKESKKKFSKKDNSNQVKVGIGNRHDESKGKRRKIVNYIAVIDWYTREVLGSQISLRGRTEECKTK
jgi:putative transposase